jgi:hypothetical protein
MHLLLLTSSDKGSEAGRSLPGLPEQDERRCPARDPISDNALYRLDRIRRPAKGKFRTSTSILTRGVVQVASSSPQHARLTAGNLPTRSDFPRRTIADTADCSELLNITAQDLLDAANVRAQHSAPSFIYSPS